MISLLENTIAQYILLSLILILAVQSIRLLEAKRNEVAHSYADTKYDNLRWILENVTEGVVIGVEQLAKSAQIVKKEKRDKAIAYIQESLAMRGFPDVPLNEIIIAIEKAVYERFNRDKPDKVTAPA